MPRRAQGAQSAPEKPATRQRRSQPALRAARDEMYRKHLFEVAEVIFSEQSFDDAKMQDVAAAAGVSLATLYRVFPSKTDLYLAVADERGGQLLEQVERAIGRLETEGLSPLGVILHGMEPHLRHFLENPAFLKMFLLQGHLWYHRASRVSRFQDDLWARGERLMEAAFSAGVEAGLLVPEDPASMGRAMVVLHQTRLGNWVLGGMKEPHDEVVVRAQADFVRTFCRPAVARRVLTDDGLGIVPEALKD